MTRMRFVLLILATIIAALAVLTIGCERQRNPVAPSNTTRNPDPGDHTRFPDQDSTLAGTEIYGNTLVLRYSAEPPAMQTNDILVSTKGQGYLKKVLSVQRQGQTLTVQTAPAKFTEAFRSAQMDTVIQVRPSDEFLHSPPTQPGDTTYSFESNGRAYTCTVHCGSVEWSRGANIDDQTYDYNWTINDVQVTIYDNDSRLAFTLGVGTVTVGMNLWIDFQLDEQDWQVHGLRLVKREDQGVTFSDVSFSGSLSLASVERKVRILDVPVLAVVPVGPLVFTVGFAVDAGVEAACNLSATSTVNVEAGFNSHSEVGAEWHDGAWHAVNINTPSAEAQLSGAQLAEGAVEMEAGSFLDFAVDLSLYAVLGPQIFLKPSFPVITASNPPMDIEAAAALSTGARLELTLFDVPLFTFEAEVWRHSLAHWSAPTGLTSTWTGIVTQPNGSLTDTWDCVMTLQQTGSQVTGTAEYTGRSQSPAQVTTRIGGSVRGLAVELDDTDTLSVSLPGGGYWCYNYATVYPNAAGDSLNGTYFDYCYNAGEYHLLKSPAPLVVAPLPDGLVRQKSRMK